MGVVIPARHDPFHRLRAVVVVGVKEAKDLSCRCRERSVDRRGLTAIFFQDQSDPRAIGEKDLPGFIGRAVVDHDEFNVRIRLLQHAVDRMPKVTGVVVIVD